MPGRTTTGLRLTVGNAESVGAAHWSRVGHRRRVAGFERPAEEASVQHVSTYGRVVGEGAATALRQRCIVSRGAPGPVQNRAARARTRLGHTYRAVFFFIGGLISLRIFLSINGEYILDVPRTKTLSARVIRKNSAAPDARLVWADEATTSIGQ
jgi:hypothetical protein